MVTLSPCAGNNATERLYQRVRLKYSANLFRASLVFFSGTVNLTEPRLVSLSVGAISNFARTCLC